ncbi:MAG: deoxyribose-phosphate aldolase [Syntrophotaleaceae bacterium]
MTGTEIARTIDHTLLSPLASLAQIEELCNQASGWGFASVCIPPRYVPAAARNLKGLPVAVGTVVGFPLGYATTATKVFETGEAVAAGADEIDMVVSLGDACQGRMDLVHEEISQVVLAAGKAAVKVIIECCYLQPPLLRQLAEVVIAAGGRFVKTSTGFGSGGAVLEDIQLLHEVVRGRIGIKASGGIKDWATCRNFLAAGATRIGTSSALAIMRQFLEGEEA